MVLIASKATKACIFGNCIDDAFEALEIHDYFKAKKLFYKNIKRKPAASAYGLSVIYSRNNNPFYNLDSALQYAKISAKCYFLQTSEKQKLMFKTYGVDTVSVCVQNDKVDELCFLDAKEKNTVEAYNHFIKNNDSALQYDFAVKNRNTLAYKELSLIHISEPTRPY